MAYAIAWFLPIALFWVLLREAPMLFFLIVYTWYPILSCVFSFRLVSKNAFKSRNWGLLIICAFFNSIVFYVTYGITNSLSMSNVVWDDMYNIVSNVIASIVGLLIGVAVKKYKNSLARNLTLDEK